MRFQNSSLTGVLFLALSLPAFAEGDPAKGEADFKKCRACHAIVAPDGTVVQKGGKTGPNLYGIVGSVVAHDPDFKYGDSTLAVHELGVIWDEEKIVDYLVDPAKWLKEQLDDSKAKSKMTFRLPKGGEDMAAYLATFPAE